MKRALLVMLTLLSTLLDLQIKTLKVSKTFRVFITGSPPRMWGQ
jgi:hypothetical protein